MQSHADARSRPVHPYLRSVITRLDEVSESPTKIMRDAGTRPGVRVLEAAEQWVSLALVESLINRQTGIHRAPEYAETANRRLARVRAGREGIDAAR